jgi:hypothetical protein
LKTRAIAIFLLAAPLHQGGAEVIDRIAVTIGRSVITLSAIDEHLRVAAFLNGEPVKLDAASRRIAAGRMAEQSLLRQEMEFTRYALPDLPAIDAATAALAKERFTSEEEMLRALAAHGLTLRTLRRHLQVQMGVLRFLAVRFRPAISVGDGEIEIHYREQFLPAAEMAGKPVPALDEVAGAIEQILMQQKTDEALDRWLQQAKGQVRIEYAEEAFQ